jgi:hypothetical protein
VGLPYENSDGVLATWDKHASFTVPLDTPLGKYEPKKQDAQKL